eukprot:CAMPEP_0202831748 /NCGR_PEP_ID=MMETSP1389-20130828/17033_1 /ASSEMBLY_ACC=CAM_ASM_000865 /TAXON_ID=302021 /ORGANISM="Rhodomonas sp., Strain CCMP768" /LENGTH=135 /DNA_ID=CAMNT_0049505513 /DNA_START=225 /DNA_END=632 /DNA_ORIENTATION=-
MRRGLASRFGGSSKRRDANREAEKKKTEKANRIAAARRLAKAEAVDLVEDEMWLIIKGVLCALSWLLLLVFSLLWMIDKRGKHMWVQFWYCALVCVVPTTSLLIWPHIPGEIVQGIRNRLRWREEARRLAKGHVV